METAPTVLQVASAKEERDLRFLPSNLSSTATEKFAVRLGEQSERSVEREKVNLSNSST